ncbi:MAG TPA: helix-turn-helix domain-containing protein [Dehalococcoidia bacterium]|jgi:AcrR family transcriptional regulator|nr:helix-turn-helix domain-containing protein [Dehalococcoidia bacterium]
MTIAPIQTIERGKRDKERRQQSLIEAATAVFAERGYDCATTREIAERAGCAEGLIHRYFGGKRGLLLAILEARAGKVVEDFVSALPDQGTLEEEIERVLLWHLDTMWERRDFMRVAVSQAAIDLEIGRTINEGIHNGRVQLIAKKLRRHKRAGRIRASVDLEATAQTIANLGFAMGFSFQVSLGQDRGDARRITVAAGSALSRGISRRSTP